MSAPADTTATKYPPQVATVLTTWGESPFVIPKTPAMAAPYPRI